MSIFKPATELCTDCNVGYLVERVNSLTKNTFIGCSEFPDCKFSKTGGKRPAPARVTAYSYEEEYDDYDDDIYADWGDIF
jgi:ssDNA-binding Zn-finger/Zn-ribbon topoisomerase 1